MNFLVLKILRMTLMINVKFSELNDRFNDFEAKYETLTCRLQDVVMTFYLSI